MHLPGGGVDQERRRRLVPLQHLLDAVQVLRQGLRRHADVLDERYRLRPVAQAEQRRQRGVAELLHPGHFLSDRPNAATAR